MEVEIVSQRSFRVRASHQAKAVLSRMRGCPHGETPVRPPSQCSDAAGDDAPRTFVGLVTVRPPAGVGETGLSAVEGR